MENNTEPCFKCEKPVRVDRPHWAVHLDVSGKWADDDVDPAEDLGWFAVGPECRRLYPGALKVDALA